MTPLEMLRAHPFFAGLPEEWLPPLTGYARPVVWHPGHRSVPRGAAGGTVLAGAYRPGGARLPGAGAR